LPPHGYALFTNAPRSTGVLRSCPASLNTEVDAVLWATGYKDESVWVAIPEVKDERGRFIHPRGVSPVPNLYFIGRRWQWTRASALFAGVGADASYLTEHIVKHLEESVVV
jgi:hypothetical protein